jgi:hypothetical protein
MSADSNDASRAPVVDAAPLFARAAAADRRAEARLATAIDDFFLAEEDRLDDRTRAAIGAVLTSAVRAIEREIASHAARQLAGQGLAAQAAAIDAPGAPLLGRLLDSGLLRDRELMGELLGEVRQDLLGEALIGNRPPGVQAVLLARLTDCGDGVVAAAAGAYLLADGRRRAPSTARRADLPAMLHRRLAWWVAAALRKARSGEPVHQAAIDRALVAAAQRSLAAHDEGDRLEAVAMRLASAIDARPEELGDLLAEALEEGRAALFIAVLAHALSIDFAEARALTLDPDGDRLWLALRAHGQDRETIARIGLALADADPRRDIEAFVDALDTIGAVPIEDARVALAPFALHPDFRAALRALERAPRRGGAR